MAWGGGVNCSRDGNKHLANLVKSSWASIDYCTFLASSERHFPQWQVLSNLSVQPAQLFVTFPQRLVHTPHFWENLGGTGPEDLPAQIVFFKLLLWQDVLVVELAVSEGSIKFNFLKQLQHFFTVVAQCNTPSATCLAIFSILIVLISLALIFIVQF